MEDFQFNINHKKHDVGLDVFRIFMGLFLMAKGGWFISNFQEFSSKIVAENIPFMQEPITYYVLFAHMVGGMLIFLGLHTRTAIFFNLPILLGAILFVHFKEGLFTTGGLEVTTMFFVFLVCVAWHGSGKISLDNIIKYAKDTDIEEQLHYKKERSKAS